MTSAVELPARLGWGIGLGALASGLGVLAGVDARLALGLAAGMAFVVMVLSDVTLGLCLFIGLEFLLPDSGGGALSIAKVAGALLALSWLGVMAMRRGAAERSLISAHASFVLLLTFFVGWAFLSALWATAPEVALSSGLRYAQNGVFFLIVYTAVRTPRQAMWVVGAFVLSAGLSAVAGVVVPVEAGAASGGVDTEGRLGGTYGEPNEFATYLVVGLVLALASAAVWRDSAGLRLAAFGIAALCAVVSFLTISRAALVAMAVALAAGILVGGRWRAKAALVALVVVALTATYFAAFASPEALERVTTTESSGRTDLWRVAWRMVEANPVQGVGAGNFRESSIDYLLQPGVIRRDEYIVDQPNLVHNIYLGALAELGVIGFLMFGAILVFSLVCALRAVRAFSSAGDVRMEMLARGLLVAIAAILAADFFASEPFSKQLWLLLALSPALLSIARAGGSRTESASGPELRPA